MAEIYEREQIIKQITDLACNGGDIPETLCMREIRDGDEHIWDFPVVMMAVHLDMYDEACQLLGRMDRNLVPGQFSGDWSRRPVDGSHKQMTYTLDLYMLILAHKGVLPELLRIIWECWQSIEPGKRFVEMKNPQLFRSYDEVFGTETREDIVDDYLGWAARLYHIHKCCPQMLYGMYSGEKLFLNLRESMLSECDVETGHSILRKYCKFADIMRICFADSPDDLAAIYQGIGFKTDSSDDFYARYKAAFQDYLAVLHRYGEVLKDTEYRRECAIKVLYISAKLYLIWTNRHAEYPDHMRRAAYELCMGLRDDIRAYVGEDPIGFLEEEKPDIDNGSNRLCDIVDHIGCLLINVGRYTLTPDMDKDNARSLFLRLYESIKSGSSKRLSLLIDFLEQIEYIKGTDNVKLCYGDAADDNEKGRALTEMIDHIIASGSVELLEVSLRKKLICPELYDPIIDRAGDERPEFIPCLLAYRTAECA